MSRTHCRAFLGLSFIYLKTLIHYSNIYWAPNLLWCVRRDKRLSSSSSWVYTLLIFSLAHSTNTFWVPTTSWGVFPCLGFQDEQSIAFFKTDFFDVDHQKEFKKSSLSLSRYRFFVHLIFWPWGMWDLNSLTRGWTHTLHIGTWSLYFKEITLCICIWGCARSSLQRELFSGCGGSSSCGVRALTVVASRYRARALGHEASAVAAPRL